MRLATRPYLRRLAAIIMMVAAMAFILQGTLIATSEAATGETGKYHHGMAHSHAHADDHGSGSHVVTHAHTDGTVHRHAIDDDELDEHVKEHGCGCCYSMAIAICVLPSLSGCSLAIDAGSKLAIEAPRAQPDADPNRLKRPPRPPSIA